MFFFHFSYEIAIIFSSKSFIEPLLQKLSLYIIENLNIIPTFRNYWIIISYCKLFFHSLLWAIIA